MVSNINALPRTLEEHMSGGLAQGRNQQCGNLKNGNHCRLMADTYYLWVSESAWQHYLCSSIAAQNSALRVGLVCTRCLREADGYLKKSKFIVWTTTCIISPLSMIGRLYCRFATRKVYKEPGIPFGSFVLMMFWHYFNCRPFVSAHTGTPFGPGLGLPR